MLENGKRLNVNTVDGAVVDDDDDDDEQETGTTGNR